MTNLTHFDDTGTARFVTFNCYRNLNSLVAERSMETVSRHIDQARIKHKFLLLGYVIMPNHIHLVIHPPAGMKLGSVIGEIKSLSAREILSELPIPMQSGKRVLWQRRCYDHNCRTSQAVREKIEYCHKNPVVAGLVRNPGDWKWSSYNWYEGNREVPLEIDDVEL